MNNPTPSEAELQRQGFGSILSRAPLVTVGKRSHFHASPVGIGPLACAMPVNISVRHLMMPCVMALAGLRA